MRRLLLAVAFLLPLITVPAAHATVTWTTYTDQWGTGPDDHVDIYYPNDGLKHPALLFVHGGGWTVDTIDAPTLALFEGLCRLETWICGIAYYPTVAEAGQTVLVSESNAVDQDLLGLRAWSQTKPGKVAVYGESAGGQLGAAVAYENPTLVKAVALSSGAVDMAAAEQSTYDNPGPPEVNIRDDVEYFENTTTADQAWATSLLPYDPANYIITSPVSYLAVDGPATPPTFTYFDASDPVLPCGLMGIEFQQDANTAGAPVTTLSMPGTAHSPDSQIPPGGTQTAMQLALTFIQANE